MFVGAFFKRPRANAVRPYGLGVCEYPSAKEKILPPNRVAFLLFDWGANASKRCYATLSDAESGTHSLLVGRGVL